MISAILHWTCDQTWASMASPLFRRIIALAMLQYRVQKLFLPENTANFPKLSFSRRKSDITRLPSLRPSFRFFSCRVDPPGSNPDDCKFHHCYKSHYWERFELACFSLLIRPYCHIYRRFTTLLRRLLPPVYSCQ